MSDTKPIEENTSEIEGKKTEEETTAIDTTTAAASTTTAAAAAADGKDNDNLNSSADDSDNNDGNSATDVSATDADNSATDANSDDDDQDRNENDNNDGDDENDENDENDDDNDNDNDDDNDDESEETNSSDEDMNAPTPEEKTEEKKDDSPKKKKGFFSRMMGKKEIESSSSSSGESEDTIDLDDIDAETIEEAIECLKLVEEEDSDWDILLDAPSDWDSDDSENKPTAPVFRSTCGYLTMETTQLREDLLNDLLESRVLLVDAKKELAAVEEDQYMKYYYETLGKLRGARDKAEARVHDEERRLAMYSQKDEGVTRLATALRFNEHLLSLTLCDTEMTEAGAESLASAIKVHPTLERLSCKHNPLGPIGAESLFRASRRNGVAGLQELDLWDCKIGPQGALLIAAQLGKDTTLTEVRLRFNQFGPIGGFAFASALMQNRVLEKLDLQLNDIGMQGALAFERILKYTVIVDVAEDTSLKSLKKLCKLCKNRIDDPFCWDDVMKEQAAEVARAKKSAAKIAAKKVAGEKKGGESGEGEEGEEGGEKKEGNVDEKDDSNSESSDESDELDNLNSKSEDEGEGERKQGGSKRREGSRARRKRLKQEAVRAKRIAKNRKFWMNSYVSTKEDLEEQKAAFFSHKTKKTIYNLVLFAGTRSQCASSIELMGADPELGIAMAAPNKVIKQVALEGNNFERAFRNNISKMKRLFGTRLTGVWQPVENFFKPTLRA
jgi:hypothetical protein